MSVQFSSPPRFARETYAFAAMWCAVAVGVILRVYALDRWPLALDEYYISKSAHSILRDGIPDFQCGGYYTRGLLSQYLTAALITAGASAELAVRVGSVIFSLATLPAAYLLGAKLRGPLVGCAAVILLSLSVWEIEFARFGRMYAPFQCVFAWYCLTLHAVCAENKHHLKPWLYALSVGSVLVWEGGIFLVALNFVPALFWQRRIAVTEVLTLGVISIACLAFLSTNFRMWGGPESYIPHALMDAVLNRPQRSNYHVLASTLSHYPLWSLGFAALGALCVWVTIKLRRLARVDWRLFVLLVATFVFACANQFGLVFATWVIIPLTRLATPLSLLKLARGAYVLTISAGFLFWVTFALNTEAWHAGFKTFAQTDELRKVVVALFKFPNVFDSILFEYLAAIPNFTLLMVIFLIAAYLLCISEQTKTPHDGLRVVVLTIVMTCAMVGALETQYTSTRYTFFLLPLVYVVVAYVLVLALDNLPQALNHNVVVLLFCLLGLAWFSEDHDVTHALTIASEDTNYRVGFSAARAEHYYPRSDYRSPAALVNAESAADDTIIITDLGAEQYLHRVDYAYKGLETSEFVSVTCNKAVHERWTGARLLYTLEDFDNIVDNATGNVWVIASSRADKGIDGHIKTRFANARTHLGADNDIAVYGPINTND